MPEVTINIANRTYRLAVSSGEEELVRSCADKVDRQIASMKETTKLINQEQIAVLAALELAYEAHKQTSADKVLPPIENQMTAQESEGLREALHEKDKEIAVLKAKIAHLQEQITGMQTAGVDAEILKEIDALSSQCEKAIYSDMHKIGLF